MFGNAKLYRIGGGYELGVLAAPHKAQSVKGELLWYFGYFCSNKAYFMDSLLHEGSECPVFEAGEDRFQRTADNFSEWLRDRASLIRRRIGKRNWLRIVEGPPPFSESELQIIETRRRFHWRVAGVSEDGQIRFQVRNDSKSVLPFLSIGIRAKDNSLVGGVWLPVKDIFPGSEKIIEKDCYREHVSPHAVEAFALPDPEPEDRDRYWEFREVI